MHRSDIIEILDGTHPRVGRRVALAIYALIVISAVIIALETLPALSPEFRQLLRWGEAAILALFAVEYVTRLICSPRPQHYAVSFWGIIDFIAIVPAVLFLFPDLITVRALRLLRLVRLLKLFKANRALDRIARAFEQTKAELLIFSFVSTVILYLAAVGIYHFEREAQPEFFGSIPASLWWALSTLTTVGYGDVYPVTTGGRIFTGCVLLVGLGVVAVPAGLITVALIEQTHEEQAARAARPPQDETPQSNTEDELT
ncbi:Potassium voltage-gated channel subfamily KQT, possible potassium channel, VIC family [Roseibacterium elongatum DSM 19469]|uniref:Potassium voltage-gated channel subfamily KQT, possible potassium channel, VIC family n=1 Tax=Roseicyclus elongatus DSM 19469 TaxID=1294273 RepID=W8RP72_9RHOB|nr:ion transporter [Roseibacterium elongatum]AHM02823.1 Potassium voltage-gated channel subfamily KQT, possible potassium channel, VIC family [Roseibacterium elongatum DSM 19469]